MQTRVGAVKLEAAETYRDIFVGLEAPEQQARIADVVVPLRYRTPRAELSFLSITAVIGTPMDVTVEELAIESFYPADPQTAKALA